MIDLATRGDQGDHEPRMAEEPQHPGPLVRRAAETVLGRFLLALFGFLLISVGMAVLLTYRERRQRRDGPPRAA